MNTNGLIKKIMDEGIWNGRTFDKANPMTYPQTLIETIAKQRRSATVFQIIHNILPQGWKIKFMRDCRYGYDVDPVRKLVRVPKAKTYTAVIFIARAALLARMVEHTILSDTAKSKGIARKSLKGVNVVGYSIVHKNQSPHWNPGHFAQYNPLSFMTDGSQHNLRTAGYPEIRFVDDGGNEFGFVPSLQYGYAYGSVIKMNPSDYTLYEARDPYSPSSIYSIWMKNQCAYSRGASPAEPFPWYSNVGRRVSGLGKMFSPIVLACVTSDLYLLARLFFQSGLQKKTRVLRQDFETCASIQTLCWLSIRRIINPMQCPNAYVARFAHVNMTRLHYSLETYVSNILRAREVEQSTRDSLIKEALDRIGSPLNEERQKEVDLFRATSRPVISVFRKKFTPRIRLVV